MVVPDFASAIVGEIDQLGLSEGLVVQELGWDEDCDEELRNDIMDVIDADLVDEIYEAVDVVLLWQRDDCDVADSLVDALRDLDEDGYIWLMTPKIGRDGYVDPADVQEAAQVAGLQETIGADVSPDWTARKIVRPKSARQA